MNKSRKSSANNLWGYTQFEFSKNRFKKKNIFFNVHLIKNTHRKCHIVPLNILEVGRKIEKAFQNAWKYKALAAATS